MKDQRTLLLHVEGLSEPLTLNAAPAQTPDQTLAQAIWLSGRVPPPPLCSGLGRCGRCRVRLSGGPLPVPLPMEERVLDAEELAQGWRLACRHLLRDLPEGLHCMLPEQANPAKSTAIAAPEASCGPLVLAVDVGTTSLHWRAVDKGGHTVAQGQEINPQMGAGSDVMSRIAAAQKPGGLALLSELVCARLRELTAPLPNITHMVLAANTAMTSILLQKDVTSLAAAPYALPLAGHSTERLPGLPPLYVPPQLAPFVGGDVSAGVAFLRGQGAKPPYVLADMGTNGEFVLCVDEEKSFITSVPLGPALEGIGLTFGDMAGAGSETGAAGGIVRAVHLSPAGLQASTIDGHPPRRICAAGYLSLARVLRQAGVLDENGTFCAAPTLPLGRKVAAGLTACHGETRLPLFGNLYLSGQDVEEILKVKAAFSLALETLLHEAGLSPGQLRRVYVAGALGEHVPAEDMEALGFVPQGLAPRITALGNTSLQGAELLALQNQSREDLARWARGCTLVSLAEKPDFTPNYMRHMRFI